MDGLETAVLLIYSREKNDGLCGLDYDGPGSHALLQVHVFIDQSAEEDGEDIVVPDPCHSHVSE
jgi:hypothetical protein